MIKIIFFIVLTIFSLAVFAQRGTVITYLQSGNIDMRDFAGDFQLALKDKKDELKDSSQRDSLEAAFSKNKQALEQAMQMLTASRPADTVTAWLENNFLITKSTSNSPGQRLFYHLQTQRFLCVDSFTRDPMRKFDTTFREVWTCTDCAVTARFDKAAGTRMIAGYACVKFIITQKIGGGEGGDIYTVWATDKIKPALPLYATLRLRKKIMPEFTMLEMKHPMEADSRSYSSTSTLKVENGSK